MALRDYFSNVRRYFSRREAELPILDERGRNAQVGYKQRENIFDKFLAFSGKTLKYAGFWAVALTGIGAIAIGVQYLRGSWPFRDVRENAYIITQNTINEKPARPLRQGVNAYIPPFVRIVEEGNVPVKIPGTIQSVETPDFEYRSAEAYKVKLKTQYNFQVTSPEGAAQVYWDYGGMDRTKQTLDTIVENALLNELSKVPAKDIANEERTAQPGERISYQGRYITAQGEEKINYLIEAENKANEVLRKERIGVVVTNFAISNPKYTQTIETNWEAPARAQAFIEEERGKAEAIIIRADAQAKEAEIIQDATTRTLDGYLETGKKYAQEEGNAARAAYYASMFWRGDNAQQMASTGKGRVINVLLEGLNR